MFGLDFIFFCKKYKKSLDIPPCGSLTMASQNAICIRGNSNENQSGCGTRRHYKKEYTVL
jgi:hypothetical protein